MIANSLTLLTNLTCGLATSLGLFLAQGDAAGEAGAAAAPAAELTGIQKILGNPLILPIGLFLIFYLTFLAPERKRKAEEAKLMSSLEKNDRVITVGGIHGTVVSTGEGVVTLKIDEGGNTRIKINRSAIASKIQDKKEAAK
ncbi:preprotein translocase subunit YajC [Stieleria marina]|uniref:Sec translocon accessory complex subunit YajC n=1 Tax=Stieleria marina TaxID=1930275 RepID=A0A517NS47_9BACT|nr:preprotein translocase subunit YajC [Planctomycetes bacterium K23_9]